MAQCMYLLLLHDTVLFGVFFGTLGVEHIGVVKELELGVVTVLVVTVVVKDDDVAVVMVVVTVDDVDTATVCRVWLTNQSAGNGCFASLMVGDCPGSSLGGFVFNPRRYISRCEGSYCSLSKCPLHTCILLRSWGVKSFRVLCINWIHSVLVFPG